MLCDELMKRQALHAFKLQLDDNDDDHDASPGLGLKKFAFHAPLPEDMAKCLSILNMNAKDIHDISHMIENGMTYFNEQQQQQNT